MKFIKNDLIIAIALILTPILSMAELGDNLILKYSDCPEIKITEPKNSNGFFFSADCKQVYIKPPKINSLTIDSMYYSFEQKDSCDLYKTNTDELLEATKADQESIRYYRKEIKKHRTALELIDDANDELIAKLHRGIELNTSHLSSAEDALAKTQSRIRSELQIIAKKQGGTAQYTINDKTEELRAQFMELNKDSELSFNSITPTASTIAYNSKNISVTEQGERFGDILELNIPLPNNMSTKKEGNAEEKKTADDNVGEGALGGEIVYSSLGACSLLASGVSSDDIFSMSQIKNSIVINRFNQYTVHIKGGYRIRFNLGEVVSVIHSQVKKRGLFKNKTKNKKFDFRELDQAVEILHVSEEKIADIPQRDKMEIRKQFLDKALLQIVALKTGKAYSALKLLQPDAKNGADVAAGELSKCLNIYCQIGAAGLKVLSAIFGSSSSVAEFKSKLDVTSTETMTNIMPLTVYSSSTYK